jgi:maltooligosyltrehalose trehalohydrolase
VLRLPAHRFLAFLQDHDQVGNRATGDRISANLSADQLKVGAGLLLTSPFTPMLFMGEEWGARTPWQYFTDHPDAEIGRAVAAGRRAEFARHGWDGDEVPDPQDAGTFARSKLDWTEPAAGLHAELLAWYRTLIALRRQCPELTDPRLDRVHVSWDEAARWLLISRAHIRIAANLGQSTQRLPLGGPAEGLLAASAGGVALSADCVLLPPWSLAVIDTSPRHPSTATS